jgi:hypothetical protein
MSRLSQKSNNKLPQRHTHKVDVPTFVKAAVAATNNIPYKTELLTYGPNTNWVEWNKKAEILVGIEFRDLNDIFDNRWPHHTTDPLLFNGDAMESVIYKNR